VLGGATHQFSKRVTSFLPKNFKADIQSKRIISPPGDRFGRVT